MSEKRRIAIIGAAGRDYHNFLARFRDNPLYEVKFFTATQIPGIHERSFPKELAGKLYKKDIPIFQEKDLPELITKYKIDEAVFSYSDITHEHVMHVASIVNAYGASFTLLGPVDTMIKSEKPVISVCAVRTGAGKSQTTRKIAEILKKHGKKVAAIRHPMPYGNLLKQKSQRFASYEDFEKHDCTIEEREEYEPWIEKGMVIYAGLDYFEIINQAEKEADILLWDGGNNDLPFCIPDLHIVVVDPHRPGHELLYYPGEANFRMADIMVMNKVKTASKQGIDEVTANIKKYNPGAELIKAESEIKVDGGIDIKGKKVVVVEDGPTLTHGEMKFGAGFLAAKRAGARILSPKPHAVGSIRETYEKYGHVSDVLPAMGYGKKQIKDLEKTINNVKGCDIIVNGSPIDLEKLVKVDIPIVRVTYALKEVGKTLESALKDRGFI